MATLLHVTGEGHEPLPPFAGHLVRNLEWHRYSPEAVDAAVDTVVASPASPADAVQLVVDLRSAGRAQSVVLLGDGSPGWRSVTGAFDAVSVVVGLDALRDLLGEAGSGPAEDASDRHAVIGADHDDRRPHVPRGGSRGMLMERLGDAGGRTGRRDDDATWAALAGDGRSGTRSHAVPDDPSPDAPADGPARQPEPARRRQRREDEDPDRLVEALLGATERLYGVRETGTAVAGHVKDVVGVDAVAVLLPDGAVWTVVGAVGHRHLEERLLLGHDHWLVQEVTQARHGLIVEDTDIARTRLAGAPLAAWPHLMACPVGEVDGMVVTARSDNGPAFGSRDLAHVSQALVEAGGLLASAVRVRELARRLRRHAELDDDSPD